MGFAYVAFKVPALAFGVTSQTAMNGDLLLAMMKCGHGYFEGTHLIAFLWEFDSRYSFWGSDEAPVNAFQWKL